MLRSFVLTAGLIGGGLFLASAASASDAGTGLAPEAAGMIQPAHWDGYGRGYGYGRPRFGWGYGGFHRHRDHGWGGGRGRGYGGGYGYGNRGYF